MLPSFEDFDGHSEKARFFLPWLIIELSMRRRIPQNNEPPAIMAKQIRIATQRRRWMGLEDIKKRKQWFSKKSYKATMANLRDGAKMFVTMAGLSDPEVRAMVNYLRDIHKYPIGSCGRGYFWIMTIEDEEITLGHLDGRINAIQKARDGVANADRGKSVNDLLHIDSGAIVGSDLFGVPDYGEISWGDDFSHHAGTPWGDKEDD